MSDDENRRSDDRESTGKLAWPGRHREHSSSNTEHPLPLAEDGYIRTLLDNLDTLEKKTRPSGGSASAKGKDFAAFEALELAGQLVEYVAGWAIDHEMGLAIENLRFVPRQPSGTKQHSQYLSELAQVDSHLHETAGRAASGDADADPLFLRKCAINLLRANAGAMPRWLQHKLVGGLEALDYGEVQPMLAPINAGRKRDFTELQLQLRALAMVAYRRKLGLTKTKAVGEVAYALGVGDNTLLSWASRLRSEFGHLEVERTIKFAENHASWVADARKKATRGEASADTAIHEAGYDEAALAELGKRYRAALKA